jgi:hypothetical protein
MSINITVHLAEIDPLVWALLRGVVEGRLEKKVVK